MKAEGSWLFEMTKDGRVVDVDIYIDDIGVLSYEDIRSG